MSNWLVRYRFWALGITLALSLVCAVLMLRVSTNTDMTKYLPSDSRMKAGLDILQNEMGMSSEMASGGLRIMTEGQCDSEKVDMRYQLLQLEEVQSVTLQENGSKSLYELGVDQAVDQVALGKHIKADFPQVVAAESPQDGATADAGMLIGALSLLLIVLAAMCASWLEPVLFLASTGVAVLLNMGSNALLPSVSMTTHSIAAILQLVLSMDYSIILLNRYRQERPRNADSLTAMMHAIRNAAPAVLSSALTTMVGLLMLVFMKLRIGADLGIVLSKGVLFSLICNFTVLPSLILIFEKGIERSQKKVLMLPTQQLASFSMKYRIPLAVFFLILLGSSYWLHNQTPITFHNAQDSRIDTFFPKKNPVVLIYDNADEEQIASLMDSMMALPYVETAISYPSLMLKEYTATQMETVIKDMSSMVDANDSSVGALPLDLVSEDVLRLVYYAAHGKRINALSFDVLINFIIEQAKDPRSFLASQMSDDLKQKMAMYEDFRQMNEMVDVELEPDTLAGEPSSTIAVSVSSTASPAAAQQSDVEEKPSVTPSVAVTPFADTNRISQQLTYDQMASFMGMDASQAKMVYRLAKHSGQTLSPVAFVHFLTDDILKRKTLASMISADQRQQLLQLRDIMDSAFVASPIAIAEEEKSENHAEAIASATTEVIPEPVNDSATEAMEIVVADDPLSLLDEMMTSHRRYTVDEMARNFSAMGETINSSLIELLYLYYGGMRHFDASWTLSLSKMISFLGDSLMNDPRFSLFITPDMRNGLTEGRKMMEEKLSMMRAADHSAAVIVTNLPVESDSTYQFLRQLNDCCTARLAHPYHLVGESAMMDEMKSGFGKEMMLVTLLTIAAILLIVAVSFRSLLVALLLVSTVMTGVFVDVAVSAIGGGSLLYMAYLVVQSILMGAAIDYGILFTNYYRESRITKSITAALQSSYRGSIHTILTSGLILVLVPGAMSVLVADPTVASIVRAISVGALATVLLVLLVLPGMLATCDRWIVKQSDTKPTEM